MSRMAAGLTKKLSKAKLIAKFPKNLVNAVF